MKNTMTQVTLIPIDSIRPNPYQPRKNFNQKALEELSKSIVNYGLIHPISVREISKSSYELIAGERRLLASKMTDMESIPAFIVNFRDKDSAIIALMENLQREDLNYIEEALGYESLLRDHGYTQSQLAEEIAKSQSTIANKLRLLRLPEDIKRDLISYNLTERHGRALLRLPDDESRRKLLARIIKNDLNVKMTEKIVNDILDKITLSKEDDKSRPKIKASIATKIYVNTIKKAYTSIKDSGVDALYLEEDSDDFLDITIRIPKR